MSFMVTFLLLSEHVHMLNIECITYFDKTFKSILAPIVIFATNIGIYTIRGTTFKSPHGIHIDLLGRIKII